MDEHTPGPWEVVQERRWGEPLFFIYGAGKEVTSITEPDAESRLPSTMAADARLVAAAPDMLAALLAIVSKPGPDAWAKVAVAIDKASG